MYLNHPLVHFIQLLITQFAKQKINNYCKYLTNTEATVCGPFGIHELPVDKNGVKYQTEYQMSNLLELQCRPQEKKRKRKITKTMLISTLF